MSASRGPTTATWRRRVSSGAMETRLTSALGRGGPAAPIRAASDAGLAAGSGVGAGTGACLGTGSGEALAQLRKGPGDAPLIGLREAQQFEGLGDAGRTPVEGLGHPRAIRGRLQLVTPDVVADVPPG